MSKFTIKLELQGLKIEVEGTKEDAPKLAQRIGQQLGGLLQAPAMLASGNANPGTQPLEGETEADGNGTLKKRRPRKSGSGGRMPAELLNFVHDPSKYGSPQQVWTTTQKAIWFLYIVSKQANATQLTATNIAKNFNQFFRAAGAIHRGNVTQGLERERLNGQNATVGADTTEGTAKYFLTQAGVSVAEALSRGEALAATAD